MRAIDRRVVACLAAAGMAGSVWGQGSLTRQAEIDRVFSLFERSPSGFSVLPACEVCGGGFQRDNAVELDHVVTVTGGSVVSSCATPDGNVAINGAATGDIPCQFACLGPTDKCPAVTGGLDSLDAGGCVLTSGPLSISDNIRVDAAGGCLLGGAGNPGRAFARATYLVRLGEGETSTSRRISESFWNWAQDYLPGGIRTCCDQGETEQKERGIVYNDTTFTHTIQSTMPGTPVTVEVDFNVQLTSSTGTFDYGDDWSVNEQCSGPSLCKNPSPFSSVTFVRTRVSPTGLGVTIVTPNRTQGAIITKPDGTYVLLGALNTPGVNPTTGSGSFTMDFEATGGVTSVDVEQFIEHFEEDDILTGDVDNNGDVCGDDRVAFMAAFGSSIGDINYTIRADFDLDGDVDAADLTHLNGIGCTADLDCDGSLTVFDQTAFSNAYSAMDPVADWDGDGMFTLFDFTGFGNTYALGCP